MADRQEELALYLRESGVLFQFVPVVQGGGGHPNKFASVLVGGVTVYCKPSSGVADGGLAAKNEVAAWEVLKLLGWTDLIAGTALRQLHNPFSGALEEAAVQVFWPGLDFCPPVVTFSDHEVFRAALFDFIIAHTDRGNGSGAANNWIGVPPGQVPGVGPFGAQQLKLIDHGYAFDYPGRAPSSAFVDARRGLLIPPSYSFAIETLVAGLAASPVATLLDPAPLDNLKDRAAQLVANGHIP